METRNTISYLISTFATITTSIVGLLLPLLFLVNTTEFFIFPKQILVVLSAFVLLALYCLKSLLEKNIIFVKNPLNLSIFVFAAVITVSSFVSPSYLTSLPQVMPVVASALLFFGMVNLINEKQNFYVVLFSLIIGSVVGGALSVLASFQIYLLPFTQVQSPFFNTIGSPVQMIGFLTPLLIFTFATALTRYRKSKSQTLKKPDNIFYGTAFIALSVIIGFVFYQIVVSNDKPVLLPFEHGFQLSLASISQDAERLLPSFLFGSGYGTFSNVFTKFHLPSFNVLPSWNLTFSYSSSYALELIATTGILGFLAFIYIIVSLIKSHAGLSIRPLFLATAASLALSFIIPYSFPLVALTFMLLGLYILNLKLINKTKLVEEVSASVVSTGSIIQFEDNKSRGKSIILPVIVTVISAGFVSYTLFFLFSKSDFGPRGLYQYVTSDIKFAESLQADALNSGETYNMQIEAIQDFPYRSDFYRIFSQVNLALATNLVNSQADAPTVNEEVQQAIIQQLQQAINSSRQAVIFGPQSSLNWRQLGQVYRNLIGVGENAEQFAIASYNQAIALEPNNPALRIELGGIYYQLTEYDLAQNQFQVAVSLKPNYANAYYNLGHSLEQKGNLQQALNQYQLVKQLVANDTQATALIDSEISALQEKIGDAATSAETEDTAKVEPSDDTDLELEKQEAQFPERDPREEIQGPPLNGEVEEPKETPTETPSPTLVP